MTKVSTPGWAWMIGGAAAAGVSALALGVGYVWWQQQSPPVPLPQVETAGTTASAQPQPEAPLAEAEPVSTTATPDVGASLAEGGTEEQTDHQEAAAAAVASGASAETPAATALSAPVLDVVRVDPEGSAVVAGSGQDGSVVIVLLDDTEVSRAEIGPDGEFVIFLPVPPGEKAQVLSLRAELDGQARASEDSFILAPVPQPAVEVTAIAETAQGGQETTQPALAPTVTPQPQAAIQQAAEETGQSQGAEIAHSEAATGESAPVETVAETAVETALAPVVDTEVPQEPVPSTQAAERAAVQVVQDVATGESKTEAKPVEPSGPTELTSAPAAEGTEAPVTVNAAQVASADAEPTVQLSEATEPEEAVTRAPAAPQVAVLKADETGISVVQPATPAVPELVGKVVLDTISYTPAGEVLLKGRSRPDALVRVYLDNAPVAEISSAGDGSWDAELSDVVPGIYTLRLDEIEPTVGRVLSRIETPFKRETPEVLAQSGAGDATPDRPRLQAVTVQQGDTLWAISDTIYGDGLLFVRVFEANRDQIRNPDLIYPGQIFNLPE